MKRVIVNADDFGLCQGVNRGIVLAHQKGILTSATLMANMPGFDEAVEMARDHPRLGVGVHLNLLRGEPVTPARDVASLVRADGFLHGSAYAFIRKLGSGRISGGDIEKELRAQIEKAFAAGVPVSHFDSEKHLHMIPPVFRIVIRLAEEYRVPRVRYVRECCLAPRVTQSFKALALSLSCRFMRRRILDHGIMTADHFYGICRSGQMTASRLRKILARLGDGVTEIMVHPGFMTSDLLAMEKKIGSYYINNLRERELQALLDDGVKGLVRDGGIQLINFSEI